MKAFWRNAALLAVSLLPFSSANAVALQAKQYGDFDRYVLALSWQTAAVWWWPPSTKSPLRSFWKQNVV